VREYDATLTDWNITENNRIVGKIYGDKKKRFPDGRIVRTSEIKMVDFPNSIAETENTVYKLGKKYSNIYEDIRALKLLRALNDVQKYCKECDEKDKKAILDFIEWKYRQKTE
jgi:hypothetical protein